MAVQETNGYLDVENATLRSSKIEVTSNLAIGNTNPQHAFSVGSNLYVDTESSNVLSVKGNVVTEGIKMGFLEIIPSYDFAAVSNVGNVTANTIIFTNDNQGFVATGNATIGSTLTISGFRITAAAAAEDDLDAITTSTDDKPNAGTTQNPIHLEGATTATSYTTGILQVGNSTNRGGMGVAGNVYVNQGVYTQDLSAENVVSNLAVNTDDLFVDIVNSRVGIGKTEPTVALDVVGAVTTSSALTVGANFAVNTDDLFVDTVNSRVGIGKTEPTVALDVVGAVSTSGDLTVTGSSKVGIGTDTLDAVLNVGSGTLASGDQILKLNTDSPWAFEHETDGLALRSSAANKKLYVQASDFSNVATFDVTTSNVGIGLTDPASKLHVMGDIIGRNVSNTHMIAGTDGVTDDTFTLLPDQNRVVVTHVGSSAADGAYTVNMTGGIPTAIGSILYLEIVSSKTNTDGVSHTHSTTLQIAADTVLTTGPITVAAVNNAGDVYERTLRRTIIRTSDGWKDYSVYPKVSVPTTDDAIIFSTTENTTQDTAGSDKPLTERLRITGNGNVGIGLTNPNYKLHIEDATDPRILLENTETLLSQNQDIGSILFKQNDNSANGTGIIGKIRMSSVTAPPQGTFYGQSANMIFSVGNYANDNANIDALTIRGNGNVGIGVTNPTSKLHIVDDNDNTKLTIRGGGDTVNDANVSIELLETATNFYGATIQYCGTLANQGLRFGHNVNTATPRFDMAIDRGTGNVGIGTNNPECMLHLSASTSSDNITDPIKIKLHNIRQSASWTTTQPWALIEFDTNDTSTSGSGPVAGIGCRFETASGGDPSLCFYTDGDNADDNVLGSANERMCIDHDGRVGINRTNPSYTLDVNGTIRATNVAPSDDRIKYNEQGVSNALTLISQLNPQKYEKIMELPNPTEGTWIPTDEEWENVKEDYTYGDEFGFIAQDVRNIPELAFLVHGEETRTDTKTSTPEEYSNLTTEEQSTYTISYVYESNTITQAEYSNLSPEEQEVSVTQYTKQIETQTPLALNYQGLFVVAIGAIKELKAKNDALEARILALENA
jgi:hypothetical protein